MAEVKTNNFKYVCENTRGELRENPLLLCNLRRILDPYCIKTNVVNHPGVIHFKIETPFYNDTLILQKGFPEKARQNGEEQSFINQQHSLINKQRLNGLKNYDEFNDWYGGHPYSIHIDKRNGNGNGLSIYMSIRKIIIYYDSNASNYVEFYFNTKDLMDKLIACFD